eukprot:gene5841-4165_t
MAKKRSFYDLDYLNHIGGSIFLFFTFAALTLSTCATPSGQLMVPHDPSNPKNSKMCYTLWGIRPNCWNAAYSWRIDEDPCPHRLYRWQSAEAFSIVALFSLFFQLFGAYFLVAGSNIKKEMVALSLFSAATTVVPWAVIASFYYTNYCGEWTLTHRNTTLGAGFKLLVTSFVVQMAGFFAVLFLEPEFTPKAALDESEKVKLSLPRLLDEIPTDNKCVSTAMDRKDLDQSLFLFSKENGFLSVSSLHPLPSFIQVPPAAVLPCASLQPLSCSSSSFFSLLLPLTNISFVVRGLVNLLRYSTATLVPPDCRLEGVVSFIVSVVLDLPSSSLSFFLNSLAPFFVEVVSPLDTMAKKRSFYDLDYLNHIGGSIFLFFTFAALTLSTCATPSGQLMVPHDPSNPKNSKMCYTLWGIRPNCWNAAYSWRIDEDPCPHRLYRWQSAEAFSIVALFSLFFQLFGAYFLVAGSNIKKEMVALSLFSAATTVVPWAVIASFYYTNYCGGVDADAPQHDTGRRLQAAGDVVCGPDGGLLRRPVSGAGVHAEGGPRREREGLCLGYSMKSQLTTSTAHSSRDTSRFFFFVFIGNHDEPLVCNISFLTDEKCVSTAMDRKDLDQSLFLFSKENGFLSVSSLHPLPSFIQVPPAAVLPCASLQPLSCSSSSFFSLLLPLTNISLVVRGLVNLLRYSTATLPPPPRSTGLQTL